MDESKITVPIVPFTSIVSNTLHVSPKKPQNVAHSCHFIDDDIIDWSLITILRFSLLGCPIVMYCNLISLCLKYASLPLYFIHYKFR